MARKAAPVTRTPRSYVPVSSRTIGRKPFHVIVPAHDNAVAIVSSNVPFQCCSNAPQQCSIGLYLLWYGGKYTSSISRRVPIREFLQAFEKLRSRAAQLGAVVEFDLQTTHAGMDRASFAPPEFQDVQDEVAGLARTAEGQPQLLDLGFPARQFQHAEGCQDGLGTEIVIAGLDRGFAPRPAAPRKRPDQHFGAEKGSELFMDNTLKNSSDPWYVFLIKDNHP